MKKIKLECWWTSSSSFVERFNRQFVFSHDYEKYEFVETNPDYTIVFGRTDWDKIETPKDRTFYFSQEPLWSPNQPKDNIHNYCSKIFISDKRDYPDRDEYIETFLPMLYSGRGEWDHREEWDWSTKIKDRNFVKSKKVSMIVRKDYCSYYNHLVNPITSEINYQFRTDLGIKLSENESIDIFGSSWETNGKNIKGEAWNKHIGLDEYMFSIGCENSVQKNYVSEKFWDIVLTESIPIYHGCSNILDYVSPDCFIYLNGSDITQINNSLDEILENYNDIYHQKKNNLLELKKEFFQSDRFNLWEKIKKEVND